MAELWTVLIVLFYATACLVPLALIVSLAQLLIRKLSKRWKG